MKTFRIVSNHINTTYIKKRGNIPIGQSTIINWENKTPLLKRKTTNSKWSRKQFTENKNN